MIDLILRRLSAIVICVALLFSSSVHPASVETDIPYYEEIIQEEKPIPVYSFFLLQPINFQTYTFEAENNQSKKLKEYLFYLESERNRIYNNYSGAEKINLFLIEEEIEYIGSLIEEYKNYIWKIREEEHPIATKVWLFMKNELGWNDIACAGALGNMMAEVGGQTLNLDYDLWDDSGEYYGLCQWVSYYCPEVMGVGLDEQLAYLKQTVEYNMNEWNVPYESFLNAGTPQEAALMFAIGYERCNPRNYHIRTINAALAYEYYTSDTRE